MDKVTTAKTALLQNCPSHYKIFFIRKRRMLSVYLEKMLCDARRNFKRSRKKSSVDAKDENLLRKLYLYSFKVPSHKLLFNSKGKNNNITVEKPGRQHLN